MTSAGTTPARARRGPPRRLDQPRSHRDLGSRFADADRHLEQGVDLAQADRAAVTWSFIGLTYRAHGMMLFWPADGLAAWVGPAGGGAGAERHGWVDESLAGIAYTGLGGALLYQGRLAEAEAWLNRARAHPEPPGSLPPG